MVRKAKARGFTTCLLAVRMALVVRAGDELIRKGEGFRGDYIGQIARAKSSEFCVEAGMEKRCRRGCRCRCKQQAELRLILVQVAPKALYLGGAPAVDSPEPRHHHH